MSRFPLHAGRPDKDARFLVSFEEMTVACDIECHAHEEAPAIGGIELSCVDDVAAMGGQAASN